MVSAAKSSMVSGDQLWRLNVKLLVVADLFANKTLD